MEEQKVDGGESAVSLEKLSLMTGFPQKLIVDELLLEDAVDEKGHVGLETLREVMIKYLDRAAAS